MVLLGLHQHLFQVFFNVPLRVADLLPDLLQFRRGLVADLPLFVHGGGKGAHQFVGDIYAGTACGKSWKAVLLLFLLNPEKDKHTLDGLQSRFEFAKRFQLDAASGNLKIFQLLPQVCMCA